MSSVLRITKDYSKFEPLPQNRNVNPRRCKRLKESMMKHGFINAYPLHVVPNGNGKLKIKEGHYRFQCAQELGLPVAYVVSNDNASLTELVNTLVRWNLEDYKDSFINAGNKQYVELGEYTEKTGIPTSRAIALFSAHNLNDGGGSLNNFKSGTFKITETCLANKVAELVVLCRTLGVKFASSGMFVNALARVINAEGFNMNRMKTKIRSHYHRMKKQASIDDYIFMLEKIFNFHASPNDLVPLALNTKKKASIEGKEAIA